MTDSREPRIEVRAEQPYLAIHRHVTDGVPAAVDSAFPELFAWLGERGIAPSGPPFMRFREVDPDGEPLELEVAAPVDKAVGGRTRATRRSWPTPSPPAATSRWSTSGRTGASASPTSPSPARRWSAGRPSTASSTAARPTAVTR